MKFILLLLISFSLFFLTACKNQKDEQIILDSKDLESQMIEAYNEGLKALEEGDVLFAAKNFNIVENIYPQSIWAPRSILMAAYAFYSQDYYGDAIAELERFIKLYYNSKNIDYAYYLLAISYYEQIVDETKDTNSILNAKKYFQIVVKNFPNTDYGLDAQFKLDLIDNILASKEMYVGRYYFNKKKWIPAINRFRSVVEDYDTTIYVEEALHRLVEIYYTLGLKEESKKYARVLGYNYESSDWYEKSYILFNKKYESKIKKDFKKDKINKNKFINKIKSLFN